MSVPLFGRDWKISVDDLDVSALSCKFHVEKSTKAVPNKIKLEIINLSHDHAAELAKRAEVNKKTGIMVQVAAGYTDNVPVIFTGDAHKIVTTFQGAERVSLITAHDGGRSYRESMVEISVGPGASVSSVIKQCAQAMGIGSGNSNELAGNAVSEVLGSSIPTGMVLSGKAAVELTRVTRAVGLQWSIQNGVLQLQKEGKPLQTESLRIGVDSGMIGSPTTDMDSSVTAAKAKKEKPTHVVVKTLMIPGLAPGRVVVLDAANFDGNYQIAQCDYVGDSAGNDWYCNLKLSPY
jgi:hypothetical protein